MKIHADEGVDRAIVAALRASGHAVIYAAESAAGDCDEDVLKAAHLSQSLLITADKDFGNLIFARQLAHSGVLLLRLAGLLPTAKAALVQQTIEQHAAELSRAFSVLSEKQLRIRRLTA